MLKRLALVLVLSTALVAPARADPITTAFFGATFAATAGGFVVSQLIGAGASFAASYVLSLFNGPDQPPASQRTTVNPGEVHYGERVPRSGVFGYKLIGGHRVHYNEYDDAKKAQLVYVLADGWCDSLSAIEINGRHYDLTAQTPTGTEHARYSVAEFGALIDIRFHDGRPGQAADPELVAHTPGWDANKKYSGQCYVAVTLTSDKDKFNGLPNFKWGLKGLRCYDRRLDSSVGGSGVHRFNDPATWVWTANPFVQGDHYLRGFYFNDERMLGAGLSLVDIDAATIVAAMNVADQEVTRPDTTPRARYEAHMAFYDTDAPADVLSRLCVTAGGFYAEKAGSIAMFAGAAQTSVVTLTDDDLTDDDPVVYSPKRFGASLYTGVQGTYTRSDDNVAAPYTAIESPALVSEDGGRARTMPFDVEDVRDPHQAYSLANQKLLSNRHQATASIGVDLKDVIIEVGDWIEWESANPLRADKVWRVVGSTLNLKQTRLALSLEEVSTLIYADDATVDDIAEPSREPALFGYLSAVSNLQCNPIALSGPGGSVLPGLEFVYDAIIDAAVAGVRFEYRVVGTTDIASNYDDQLGDGVTRTTNGVAPGRRYEVRALIDTMPGRTVAFTDWVEASGDTSETIATVSDIGFEDFSEQVNQMRRESYRAVLELSEYLKSLGSTVANMDESSRTELKAKFGEAAALVVNEALVRADQYGSLAQSMTATVANYNDVSAFGQFSMISEAAPDGFVAKITMAVRGSIGGQAVLSAISLLVDSEGSSQIIFDADRVIMIGKMVSQNGVRVDDWDTGDIDIQVAS